MRYRDFGQLGWQTSVLGFGAMRLPVSDGVDSRIDEPEAIRMIRHAIDHGVNYVDTAYVYHRGNSEAVVGKALQDGYRQRVKVATKLPVFLVKAAADAERFLSEQEERLGVGTIDLYLLHSLNNKTWQKVKEFGLIEFVAEARAKGRIAHVGFSFHDDLALFKEIVDATNLWDFCQIQYNYMDVAYQAGTEGLRYAAAKGLPVVVMEPLLGGSLANPVPPGPVAKLWAQGPVKRTPADWALQWLWDQPEVTVVLSGMSAMEQVMQNLASASRAAAGSLTEAERELIAAVRAEYRKLIPMTCTACGYCVPCPVELPIPNRIEQYNQAVAYNRLDYHRWLYQTAVQKKADLCTTCGECEAKCPQGLPVRKILAEVHAVLGQNKQPSYSA